ncbi:hypothetical protein QR680_019278 [Steinernema hermaphroditum]|uniref:Lysosome-associated membrane glycoprotein 2-like transmembrane domain-containing protein n=1 Tax=Steinernema hermaphroditum TaxID=289476 RepID=A0AA39GNL1_9BILA|nr:hypothetical protein QR680_019278 [Steinernema hermaphroditum]
MRMKALLFVALLSLATGVLGGSDVYTFKDKNNRYCLILDVDFEGSIQYSTKDNKTQEYKFNVTKAFPEQEGNCHTTFNKSLSANVITIKFHPNDITPAVPESQNYWEIDLTFVDRADKNEIELADYKLSAYFFPSVFKDAAELTHEYVKDPSAENTIHWAKADKVYKAYQCSSAGVSFEKESKLSLNNLKVTAFANLDTAEIPKDMDVEKCPMDIRTSDIVPIVVGACLAGLVIIVLVAYLIGRARAKRQGYASV